MDDSLAEDVNNLNSVNMPSMKASLSFSKGNASNREIPKGVISQRGGRNISAIQPKKRRIKQIDPASYAVSEKEVKKKFREIKKSPTNATKKGTRVNLTTLKKKQIPKGRPPKQLESIKRLNSIDRLKKKASGHVTPKRLTPIEKKQISKEYSVIEQESFKRRQKSAMKLPKKPNLNNSFTNKLKNKLEEVKEEVIPENGRPTIEVREDNLVTEEEHYYFDSSKCVYCLNYVTQPVSLSCGHEMCLDCAEELFTITNFLRDTPKKRIKCTKCNKKTEFQSTVYDLIRKDWKRNKIKTVKDALNSNQTCEICPDSREIREIAEYECLNCDTICCLDCKSRHLMRHVNHKIIRISQQTQEKTEATLCERHKEPNKLYCVTEGTPCCLVCCNYEEDHKDHTVKSIRAVLDQKSRELGEQLKTKEEPLELIENFYEEANKVYDALLIEKQQVLAELVRKCDAVVAAVRARQSKLEEEIDQMFSLRMQEVKSKLDFCGMVGKRMKYYRRMHCLVDIDVVERIELVKLLNQKINKFEGKYVMKDSLVEEFRVKSLGKSVFLGDPQINVDKAMRHYRFRGIEEQQLERLSECFTQSSILESVTITSEIFVCLPEIESASLLYKMSRDGCSPEAFHRKCDNKGKTVTLVKLDTGHIFGGFCPIDYISEYMYCDTREAFLFSLTDGKFRKPFRCPVKPGASAKAIKQNEESHSPSFGETDYSDLMIAFKNLKSSYSKLGNVYECPEGYEGTEFLAGRPTNWNIVDIEVFSVETADDF